MEHIHLLRRQPGFDSRRQQKQKVQKILMAFVSLSA